MVPSSHSHALRSGLIAASLWSVPLALGLQLVRPQALQAESYRIGTVYGTVLEIDPANTLPEGRCLKDWYDPELFLDPSGNLVMLAQGNFNANANVGCLTDRRDAIWPAVRNSSTGQWTVPDNVYHYPWEYQTACPSLQGPRVYDPLVPDACNDPTNPNSYLVLASPSVVKVGDRYFMAFVGNGLDFGKGVIYWAVSTDGLRWTVYNTDSTTFTTCNRVPGATWTPIVQPQDFDGNNCTKRGAGGPMLVYSTDPALGPEGGFYLFFSYKHAYTNNSDDNELMALRFSYSSAHCYGFGSQVKQLYARGQWLSHSGRLVWDYDGIPPVGSDPILRRHDSLSDKPAGLAQNSAAGDIKYNPATGKWVFIYTAFGQLYTQTTTNLGGARWTAPQRVDITNYLAAYELTGGEPNGYRPNGFIYYPGLWYGTLGTRTGMYVFIPVDNHKCQPYTCLESPSCIDFTGLGVIAADLDSVADPAPITSATSFYTVNPCRVIDTRDPLGPYGGPVLAGGQRRKVLLGGRCGVPLDAKSVSINLTVTGPNDVGNLIASPGDTWIPDTSNINFSAGQTRACSFLIGLGFGSNAGVFADTYLSVYYGQFLPTAQVHFIIDVNGYFK